MNFFDILFKRIEGFFKSLLSRLTTKLGKIRQLPVTAAKKAKDILQGIFKFIVRKPSELSDYVKLGGTYVAKRALLAWLLLAAAAVMAVVWLLIPFLQRTFFTRRVTVNTADFFTAAGNAEVYTEYGTLLYAGKLSEGAAQGDGRLYDDGVLIYQGSFADNEYSGSGSLYTASGALLYEGEFSGSVYSGEGKLYGEGGVLLYEGGFSAGLYDGKGTEYYPSGRIRSRGSYTAGVLDGEGQLYAEDGKLVYSGGFLNGKYSGSGELYGDNGKLLYMGGFTDGVRSGEGTEYGSDGEKIYSGGFASGAYSGSGTLYRWNGAFRLEGQFENGLANGQCTIFRGNGEQIFTGTMTDGEISWYSFVTADKSAVQTAFTSASGERALSDGRTLVYYADFGCGFIFSADGKPDRMLITGGQELYGASAGASGSSPEKPGELYDSYAYAPTAADRRVMKYIGVDAPSEAVCEKYLRDGIFVKLYLFDGRVKWYEIGAV